MDVHPVSSLYTYVAWKCNVIEAVNEGRKQRKMTLSSFNSSYNTQVYVRALLTDQLKFTAVEIK